MKKMGALSKPQTAMAATAAIPSRLLPIVRATGLDCVAERRMRVATCGSHSAYSAAANEARLSVAVSLEQALMTSLTAMSVVHRCLLCCSAKSDRYSIGTHCISPFNIHNDTIDMYVYIE